jgi:hypothetical protein
LSKSETLSIIEVKRAQNTILLVIGRLESEFANIIHKYYFKKKTLQVSSKRKSHWLQSMEIIKPIIAVFTRNLDILESVCRVKS